MGCYARCKFCNSNMYIQTGKAQMTFPLPLICGNCNRQNNYYQYEIVDERHDFSCPFCKKNFFIKKQLPRMVKCPHCKSQIYADIDGSASVLTEGQHPNREGDTAGGLLGGAAVGSLFGPAGAILGALLGAALGHQGLAHEAEDDDAGAA